MRGVGGVLGSRLSRGGWLVAVAVGGLLAGVGTVAARSSSGIRWPVDQTGAPSARSGIGVRQDDVPSAVPFAEARFDLGRLDGSLQSARSYMIR